MKLPKLDMNLGAEPKKMAILGGLLLLAAYFFYTNTTSTPPESASSSATTPARKAAPAAVRSLPARRDEEAAVAPPKESASAKQGPREFRPSLKPKKGEERSAESIDPSLRLDLLRRLAEVKVERAERSLFDFGSVVEAVKPKLPEPKIEVKKVARRMIGPEPPPPPTPPPAPPVKPPPPPINLKFFGNALPTRDGHKRVFCLQGDEILTPGEGDVILKRYMIVSISATTVVVEDLDYKNRQTLPIEDVPQNAG